MSIHRKSKEPKKLLPLIKQYIPQILGIDPQFDRTRFQMICFFGEVVEVERLDQLKEYLSANA